MNRRPLGNVADWNELVRFMRHAEQSRSIGELWNTVNRVKSRFEQDWAHFERGFPAGQAHDVTRFELLQGDLAPESPLRLLRNHLHFETF